MKKFIVVLLVVFTAITMFGGCSSKMSGAQQVYVYGTAQEPGSLNPDALDEPYGFSIYQNIFNRLVKFTNSYKIVPDIAKSWEFSSDKLKLTFHLAEDVKWHDGVAFSSEDVKWTFDTIIAKKGVAAGSLSNVERIDCVDSDTVSFILKSPDVSILSTLSKLGVFIMPKHKYDKTDWLNNKTNLSPIGTGPFKFTNWNSGNSITLIRNDNYFGTKPKLDKVVFKFIPDENTAWLAWMNDEIDWYDSYPFTEVKKLEGNDKYTVVNRLTANITYLVFNTKTKPFNDVAVRKAFAAAINRDEILATAYQGVGKASEYAIASVFKNYADDNAKLPSHYSDKAKRILKEAGYKADADGYYVTVDFEYFDLDKNVEIADVLQSQLAKSGIKLNLKQLEYTTWQEDVVSNSKFTCTLLSGNQGPTIYDTINRFNPQSSISISGYDNPELRQYIAEAVSASEDKQLKTAFGKIQKLLINEIPNLNLIEKVEFLPLKSKIHGHPLTDAVDKASPDELTYIYFD